MHRLILLFVLAALPVSGAMAMVAGEDELNALDYIPPSRFVGAWTATGNEVLLRPREAGYLLGDNLPLLLEYEPVWFASEIYALGEDEMTVEIFQFPSATDAFGFYSVSNVAFADLNPAPSVVHKPYDPPPSTQLETIRLIGDEFMEGHQDRFYFRIHTVESELALSGLRAALYLVNALPGSSVPARVAMLPGDSLVRGSERYIRGPEGLDLLTQWTGEDFLGFDDYTWEAAAGQIRLGSGEYYLLIIAEYEDADICRIAGDRLQRCFEEERWETVIVSPMRSGIHPRAFSDETYSSFWTEGKHLHLLWDLSSRSKLTSAISQYDS